MVSLFNLWNLFQTSEESYEFDITPANVHGMKQGSVGFFASCFRALGIEGEPKSWEVIPFRCFYFSDYVDASEAWEDRWAIGWNVRIKLQQPRGLYKTDLSGVPISLDATDPTWEYEYHDPRHETTALLVSVHDVARSSADTTKQRLLQRAGEIETRVADDDASICKHRNGLDQLRIFFRGVSFPAWVASGDDLVSLCRRKGGLVNFRQVLLRESYE